MKTETLATGKIVKPKRGTVGHQIQKLVKRFGHYPMGIYILEQALTSATKTEGVYLRSKKPGCVVPESILVHDSEGYKAAEKAEKEIIDRIRKDLVIL